ncbi:MAG: HDIG domain-containing protein [Planctomycetes bacterium]|nr:HDIG domain-containing protein [Planctomycetota bacterium]
MPTPLLTPPPDCLAVLQTLRSHGHTAYLCGGCVRDALLGRPAKDYDIATAATPEQVEALFPRTVPVGKAFGVMIVVSGDVQYEVATFRSDLAYIDGRRPEGVVFSTPREDAERRDFTMNALFYDPFTDEVVDYVGGREDIRRRLVRAVGDPPARFREDNLRLLRAVRFAARTGFAVEDATWRAVTDLAPLAATVSPERIAQETEKMLLDGQSRRAFSLLYESGLLAVILPEVAAMAGVEQPPDFHPEGDVWEHTLILLDLADRAVRGEYRPALPERPDAPAGMDRGEFTPDDYAAAVRDCRDALKAWQKTTLAWAGLLHDIGKPQTFTVSDRIRFNNHDLLGAEMAVAVLTRLRRSRRVTDGVYDLIRRHIHFSTLRKMRKSKLRRWLQDSSFPMHLELHRLDCESSHRMLANWFFGVQAWREEKARPPEPEPLFRGGDLVALGLPPGPEIGKILAAVEDARLEGTVGTHGEALALARRLAGLDSEGKGGTA